MVTDQHWATSAQIEWYHYNTKAAIYTAATSTVRTLTHWQLGTSIDVSRNGCWHPTDVHLVSLQCESEKVAPHHKKTYCNIFTRAKYISVKFCQFVLSLYPHILAILVDLSKFWGATFLDSHCSRPSQAESIDNPVYGTDVQHTNSSSCMIILNTA